jgi:hypothetical protein
VRDRLVREKERYLTLAKEIDGRIAERQQSTFQLERLVEYCARAAQNLDSFGFEEKRMAFQALQIRITANGGDWDVDGSIPIPLDEGDDVPEFQTLSAGTVYDGRASLMNSWRGG